MSSRHHSLSKRQLLFLAAALLLCSGSLHTAYSQSLRTEGGGSRIKRSSNPQVNFSSNSGRALDKNQKAIEQAIKLGNEARDKNEYVQALAYYQKAQELNQQDARVFYGMGNVYSDLLCKGSAIKSYLKALDLNKDYLEAHIGLGYAYTADQRYDRAESHFQLALKLAKDNVDVNIGLGLLYAEKGKYQEAINQIKLVINTQSLEDQASVHVALGNVYDQQVAQQQQQLTALAASVGLPTNDIQMYRQEAIAEYEKAISLKHDLAVAYLKLGLNQLFSALYEAGFSLEKLKSIKTQDLDKLVTAVKRASDNIKTAIDFKFNHPLAHLWLALAFAYQHNHQEAVHKIKDYFESVKELETPLSSAASNCDSGLSHLNAWGYWGSSSMYVIETAFVSDKKREAELLNEAAKEANRAIDLKQDFAEAHDMLASIYYYQEKYEESIRQRRNALLYGKGDSQKTNAYLNIAGVYIQQKKYPEAFENLQEAIKHSPNELSLYVSLMGLYLLQGKYEEAIKQFNAFLPLPTEASVKAGMYMCISGAYFKMGRYPEAIQNIQEAIKLSPKQPFYVNFLAGIYAKQGKYEDTVKQYKMVLSLLTEEPSKALVYANIGTAYVLQGKFEEAIDTLRKAIDLNLKVFTAETNLMLAAAYLGRYAQKGSKEDLDAAINVSNKAVEIKPELAVAYLLLGGAYKQQSKADEALANYKLAAQYDQKNPLIYSGMAYVYFYLKRNDDMAIESLNKAIELKSDYAEAYAALGTIYHHKNNDAKASEYLEKAIKLTPMDPRLYGEMGKFYEDLQKNEDAIHKYEEAMNLLNAGNSWAKNLYLGRIARLQGRYAEAISYFQKLPQAPTEMPGQTQYDIGLTHVASKNKKAALEQYQQLMQMKSPLAEELLKKIHEMQ